jgi:predicted 3-demethylubiquinone-9 3-methyltransferase (glyoxalase superfamily)
VEKGCLFIPFDLGGTVMDMDGNAIQVRKLGKGASIWVAVSLQSIAEPWADALLRNIFSEGTFEWCRQRTGP